MQVQSEVMRATPVEIPSQSRVAHIYKSTNLADAFAIQLPTGTSDDPELLARFIFSNQPSWIGKLIKIRDAVVVCFGLKTAKHLATLSQDANSKRISIFKVYSASKAEVVLGEDDKHLDFRVSVFCSEERATEVGRQLIVSTVVQCHNLLGRTYILVIAPFHRMVVKASLRRAAHIGWPRASGSL
ncbi:MAG: DUF2867 domain-containing protein [Burkholderiaceae bacterium]|nr:MAG: DUF2867 domain-containing protein [Burkholderiaceae bacterium]